MCTFPLPKIIQSDNGTEFCNAVIRALLETHGIDHRTIAAYNPRANGSAENAVGTTQVVLRKLLNGFMKEWDLFLPMVQLALNSKCNDSTTTSPASLLSGANVNAFANYDRANSKLLTVHELIKRQQFLADLVRPAAADNFRKKQQIRTDAVDAKLKKSRQLSPPIHIGTLVMVKNILRSSKQETVWIGPFRIVRQTRGGTYVLQNEDLSLHHREPPRDQLKVIAAENGVPFENLYTVEKILNHRGRGKNRE